MNRAAASVLLARFGWPLLLVVGAASTGLAPASDGDVWWHIRAGEEVQIIDNATKEDKTEVTLALIISEDLKSKPRSVPLGTLASVSHSADSLRARPAVGLEYLALGRFFPSNRPTPDLVAQRE